MTSLIFKFRFIHRKLFNFSFICGLFGMVNFRFYAYFVHMKRKTISLLKPKDIYLEKSFNPKLLDFPMWTVRAEESILN